MQTAADRAATAAATAHDKAARAAALHGTGLPYADAGVEAAEAAEAAQEAAYEAGAEATSTAAKQEWEAVANLAAEAIDVWMESGIAEWDRAARFRRLAGRTTPQAAAAAGLLLQAVAEGLATEYVDDRNWTIGEARSEWLSRAAKLDAECNEAVPMQAGGSAPGPETEPTTEPNKDNEPTAEERREAEIALERLKTMLRGARPRLFSEGDSSRLEIEDAEGNRIVVEWN